MILLLLLLIISLLVVPLSIISLVIAILLLLVPLLVVLLMLSVVLLLVIAAIVVCSVLVSGILLKLSILLVKILSRLSRKGFVPTCTCLLCHKIGLIITVGVKLVLDFLHHLMHFVFTLLLLVQSCHHRVQGRHDRGSCWIWSVLLWLAQVEQALALCEHGMVDRCCWLHR